MTRTEIKIDGKHARIRNGRIEARIRIARRLGADVRYESIIGYCNSTTGEELLAETRPHFAGPPPRSFKPLASDSFQLEATFKAYDGEHLMVSWSAPARLGRSQGHNNQSCPAEHACRDPVRHLFPRIRVPVEQSGGRMRDACHQYQPMTCRCLARDGLLDHGRGNTGTGSAQLS